MMTMEYRIISKVLSILLLFVLLPQLSAGQPIYKWSTGYITESIRDAKLVCDLGNIGLNFRGAISGSKVFFRNIPVLYKGEQCKVVVNNVTVGLVTLNQSGLQKFSLSKNIGSSLIHGYVTSPSGEPVDAVIVAIREAGGGGFLGGLLKLFLIPIGIASMIVGLALDLVVGTIVGIVVPQSIGRYNFPLFRVFSLPLEVAASSGPIRIDENTIIAVSSSERGFTFEGSKWRIKAIPAIMLIPPPRVLELGSKKTERPSDKNILVFLDDFIEEGLFFRNFATGYSESDQVVAEAPARGVATVKLVLKESYRVSGYVYLKTGRGLTPIKNAVVAVAQGDGGGGYSYTGEDGYFEVATNVGNGTVKVFLLYVPGYAVFKLGKGGWTPLYIKEFSLPEQLSEANNIRFEVEPTKVVKVTGRVVFRGKPVSGALVYISPLKSNVIIPGSGTLTGEDGRFSLELYSTGGEYRVVVEYPVNTVSGWSNFSPKGDSVDVGDIEIYGWLDSYSIINVDVKLPEGMVRAYTMPYLVDSKGNIYTAGTPVPAGKYKVKVDPVVLWENKLTSAFQREVEVNPGDIVDIQANLEWLNSIPRVDIEVDLSLKKTIYLLLTVDGDGFSKQINVALNSLGLRLPKGSTKLEVYRSDELVFSKAVSGDSVRGTVETKEPGVYKIIGLFKPEGYGEGITVSYEYIRWGGKPEVSLQVTKGSSEVEEVEKDDIVTIRVAILDRRLAIAPQDILGTIQARIYVTNPEGKVVFDKTYGLFQAKQTEDGRELYTKLKLNKEGEWIITVEVVGQPYIEDVVVKKTILVKQNLGWLVGLLLILAIIIVAVVLVKKLRGRGSRVPRREEWDYVYGELEW